jgi:hypothetical protein
VLRRNRRARPDRPAEGGTVPNLGAGEFTSESLSKPADRERAFGGRFSIAGTIAALTLAFADFELVVVN